jgi:hypothetical protein
MRALAWLKHAYPDHEHPSEEAIKVYVERLQGYTLAELGKAARHCVDTEKHFPTIAALVAAVEAGRPAVPKWTSPQLPAARISQDEAKAAIGTLLAKWGSKRQPERQPGDDDPEAA